MSPMYEKYEEMASIEELLEAGEFEPAFVADHTLYATCDSPECRSVHLICKRDEDDAASVGVAVDRKMLNEITRALDLIEAHKGGRNN